MVQLIHDINISELALKEITKSTAHLLIVTGICVADCLAEEKW